MHLRLLPPAPQPSILFTFSLPNLPPALPFPPAYAAQLQFLLTTELDPPPTPYVLDKSVWAIHLIDTVTFDLTGANSGGAGSGVPTVEVHFIDGEVVTWEIQRGEHAMLDRVLEAVKMSTLEAQNEKMAELRKATSHYNHGPFNNGSTSSSVDHHHHEHDGAGHSRHQSMSGGRTSHKRSKSLFNSLLSALNLSSGSQQQPPVPPLPPLPNLPSASNRRELDNSVPSYIDMPYRIGGNGKRDNEFLEHLSELRTYQAVMQPRSQQRAMWYPPSPYTYQSKEPLPTKTLTASRQLRRNARSTLVDCFRRWVIPRVKEHLRWGSFMIPDYSDSATPVNRQSFENAKEVTKWGKMSKATNAYADWACRSMIARCELAIRSAVVTAAAERENAADRTITEKESRRSSATSTLTSAFTASSRASSSHQEQEDRPHHRPTSLQSHNSYASSTSTSKQTTALHGALARFHALHDTVASEARGLAESHTLAMRMLEERGRRRGWSSSEGGGLRRSPLRDAAKASNDSTNPGSKALPITITSPTSPSFPGSRTSPSALSFGLPDGGFGDGYGYGTGWSIWELSIPLVRSSLGEISSTYEDLLMEWEMEQEFGGFGSGDEGDSFPGIDDFDAEDGIGNGEDNGESDGEYTCSPNQSSILLPDSSSHILSLDDTGDVSEDSEGAQDPENLLSRSPTLGLGLGQADHSEFSDSSSEGGDGDEDLDRELLDALNSESFTTSASGPSPGAPAPTPAASSSMKTPQTKVKGHRSRKSGIQARLGVYEDVKDEVLPAPPLMALSPPRPIRAAKSSMGPEDISNASISSVENDEDKEAGGIGMSPEHPSKIEAALQNAQTSQGQAGRSPRSPRPAKITVPPQAQTQTLSRSQSYHRREAAFYDEPLPNPIMDSERRDGASVDLWKSEHQEAKGHGQVRAATHPHPTAGPTSSNLAGIGAGGYVARARSRSGGLGILEQVGAARMSQEIDYPAEHGVDGVGIGYPPGLHGDMPGSPRSKLAPLSPRSSSSTLSPPSSPPPPSPPRRESYYIQRDLPREIPPVPPVPEVPTGTLPPTPRLSYEKPIVVGRGRTPNVLKKTPKHKPKLSLAFPEPPTSSTNAAAATNNNAPTITNATGNVAAGPNVPSDASVAKGPVNSHLATVQRVESETPALLLDTPTVEHPSSTYPYNWEVNVVPNGVVVVGTVGVVNEDSSKSKAEGAPKKIKKVRPILCVTPPPRTTTFSLGRSKSFKSLPKLSSSNSLDPNKDGSTTSPRPSLGRRRRSVEVLSSEPPSPSLVPPLPSPPLPSPPLMSPSSVSTTSPETPSPETPSPGSSLSPCPSTPSLTHSLSYTSTSTSACSVATITDSGEGSIEDSVTVADGPGVGPYDGIVMTPYSHSNVHQKGERRIAIVHQEADIKNLMEPMISSTSNSGRRHTRSRSKTDAAAYFLLPPQLPPAHLPPPPRPSKSPKRSVSSCSMRKAANGEGVDSLKSKSAENLPIGGVEA